MGDPKELIPQLERLLELDDVGLVTSGEALAWELMEESDGRAEVILTLTFGESGDPLWWVDIRFDGETIPTTETDLGSKVSQAEALHHAIHRLVEWLKVTP